MSQIGTWYMYMNPKSITLRTKDGLQYLLKHEICRAETIRPPHDTIRIAIFTSRFDFFGSIPLTIIKGNKSL